MSRRHRNKSHPIAKAAPPQTPPASEATSILAPPALTPSFFEIGSTGLRRTGGLLTEEFNPTIRGGKWFEVAKEMRDNEPVLAGAMLATEMLIRRAPFSAKPKNSSHEASREAAFIDECRADMSHTWTDHISEVVQCIVFGASYNERVHKVRRGESAHPEFRSKHNDGRIGWAKFSPRPMDSLAPDPWVFNERTGQLVAMRQMPAPDYRIRTIPIEKMAVFRIRSNKDSPEGRSLFRGAYVPYYFAKRIRDIEAIGVERDLAGLPDMQIPVECFMPSATAAQVAMRTHFEKTVSKIRRGEYEGIVRPSELDRQGNPTGFKFGLVSSGGRRPVDVDAIVKRYESRELIALLCEFLMLGLDKVGSFALSSDKTELFSLGLAAILDMICEVYNRVEIPNLMRLNGVPEDLWPTLEHGDVEKVNLLELAQYAATLTGSGHLVPGKKLDEFFREQASLPIEETEGGVDAAAVASNVVPIDPKEITNGFAHQAAELEKSNPDLAEVVRIQAAAIAKLEGQVGAMAGEMERMRKSA